MIKLLSVTKRVAVCPHGLAGFRDRYTLATKLINELAEAADDKQLSRTINRYGRVDLLCVDLCRRWNYADAGGLGWEAGWSGAGSSAMCSA